MKKILSVLISLILIFPVSVLAGKGIIVLDASTSSSNMVTYNYLLWLTTNAPVSRPNFQSSWAGASAAETAALQAGTIVEERYNITVATSTSVVSLKSILLSQYSARSSYFNSQVQPGTFYGVFFDTNTLTWSQ